jgi:hypothetical protein
MSPPSGQLREPKWWFTKCLNLDRHQSTDRTISEVEALGDSGNISGNTFAVPPSSSHLVDDAVD